MVSQEAAIVLVPLHVFSAIFTKGNNLCAFLFASHG